VIIPQYWAEARIVQRVEKRQVTVRRFGWSDVGQEAAQAHAQTRAEEALARILNGERLERRELKSAYNGAAGVPIREEIVARIGDAVITRNSYGARCLNTPGVLFADIDFDERPPAALGQVIAAVTLLGAGAVGWGLHSWWAAIIAGFVSLFLGYWFFEREYRRRLADSGGTEQRARDRVAQFCAVHPAWHLRLYRTPAGLRVLAMHRTFDAAEAEVADCFSALGVDRVYARMCLNQHCFRARLSAKPWRIGVGERLRPRPGVWPINPERLPERLAWVERYEAAARGYAACRFLEALGSSTVDPAARAVQELHDEQCGALGSLPLA